MELFFRILANGSINDVEKLFRKIGINIANNDGSYKTVDEVFNELTKNYNNLKR